MTPGTPSIPPKTPTEWETLKKRYHPQGVPSLSSMTWFGGASRLQNRNFIALRVLWPELSQSEMMLNEDMIEELGLRSFHENAKHWLGLFPPFQAYLHQVRNNEVTSPWRTDHEREAAFGIGVMEDARKSQRSLISGYYANKKIVDEETVFTALRSFLQAVIMRHPDVRCEFSTLRKEFKAPFGNSTLRAKVDGCLLRPSTGGVSAIIETKRFNRNSRWIHVPEQQAAEVVAVLRSQQQPPTSPLFVFSQEGLQIFIIAAVFSRNYINYLCGRSGGRSFLEMRRFGPWDIDNAVHLKEVASLVLAIAISKSQ